MKTIRAAIEIAQAQEVVFDLTQNYAKRLEWDPYLSEAYLMKNATEPAVELLSNLVYGIQAAFSVDCSSSCLPSLKMTLLTTKVNKLNP